MDLVIREVENDDASDIAAIYRHHVLTGTASYDVEPPSVTATLAKIKHISTANWPFLVAVADGELVGYAYLTQFRDRAAYRFTAEDSIYIDGHRTGAGIGKRLLRELIERAANCGFKTIIAVIGGAEPASIALHSSLGFMQMGRLSRVGFKFGCWLDNVYMQRDLP